MIDDELRAALEAAARAAVAEAVAAAPIPRKRPGSVRGIDPDLRTVTVLVDGDTDSIVAQSLIELPSVDDRVMVEFDQAGAVFVAGNLSTSAIPPGILAPYSGPIEVHADSSAAGTSIRPPKGWLWCAGQAVSRSAYAALFRTISTTYGTGDGTTTFNVPDYRGRVFLGLDNMGGSDAGRLGAANTLGGTGGQTTMMAHVHGLNSHTHSTPNHSHAAGTLAVGSHTHDLASHTHTVNSHDHGASTGSATPSTSSDGSHSHSSSNAISVTSTNLGPLGGTQGYIDGYAGVTIDSAGSHSHTVNSHTHSISAASPGTGSPSNNTSGSASPGLTGSTASDGSGTSGASSGDTASTGSGSEQLPPYMLIHILIKT